MKYTYLFVFFASFIFLVSAASVQGAPSDTDLDQTPITEKAEKEALKATLAEELDERVRAEGITRAYHGHGWATAGDKGYVIQALWLRNNVENLDDLPEHARQLAMQGGGIMRVGVGADARVYRLEKLPSRPNEIRFAVTAMEREDDASLVKPTGELIIARDPYSDVSTWEGTLVFDQSTIAITRYDIELGTRSVPVEDMERIERLIEQRNRNGFDAIASFQTMLRNLLSVFD